MEIIFANFGKIYSSLKSFFWDIWDIEPFFISIAVMLVLIILKAILRLIFYGSSKKDNILTGMKQSIQKWFFWFKVLFNKESMKTVPNTLWHITWIVIIFSCGIIVLAALLEKSKIESSTEAPNTHQTQETPEPEGTAEAKDRSAESDDIRLSARRIASGITIIIYLLVLKSLLWRLIKDLQTPEIQRQLLRQTWFTTWGIIFFSFGIIYLSNSFKNLGITAAVVGGIIGIAFQTPLKGIVGWLMLTTRSTFKEEHYVQIGNIKGTVDQLTLMSVILKDAVVIKETNETSVGKVHIPTSTLFDQTIINAPAITKPESKDVTQS